MPDQIGVERDKKNPATDRHKRLSRQDLEARVAVLEEQQTMWLLALQEAGVILWEWTRDHGGKYYDRQSEIAGFEAQTSPIQQKNLYSILPEVELNRFIDELQSQNHTPHPEYHAELSLSGEDHIPRYFEITGKLVKKSPDGVVQHVIGTLMDITHQKELELEIRESEERYRQIVEYQTELICQFLGDGTLTFVNKAYCKYFGLSKEAMVGSKFGQFIHDEDRPAFEAQFSGLIMEQTMGTSVHREILPNGEIRWIEWKTQFLKKEGSDLDEYQAVGRDITEHVLTETVLRESGTRFRLVAENATDLIGILDPSTLKFIYISPSCEEILGYKPGEIIGENSVDFTYIEDQLLAKDIVRRLRNRRSFSKIEIRATHRNGRPVWLEAIARIMQKQETGEPMEILAIARDITERKLAEEEDRHRSKRAAMLREVDQIILTSESPSEFVQPVLHGVRRYLECDLVLLTGYDQTAQTLNVLHTESAYKQISLEGSLNFDDPYQILRYRTGFIEWINELDEYINKPEFMRRIQEAGMHSAVVAPLVVQGELIGMISLGDRQASAFGQEQVDFIRQVAVSLAFGLRQSFLLDELRTLLGHYEALRQSSLELAGELDLDTLLVSIVNSANEMADTQMGALMLFEPERNVFQLRVSIGGGPLPVGTEIPFGEGLTGAVFSSGEITYIENYANWEGRLHQDKDYPPYRVAAIPIALAQEKLGVLMLVLKETQQYSKKIEDLLRSFSMQAAIAIKNAELYEAERKARSQLSDLNQYLQSAREAERSQIAREIHDEFGQLLTALKMDTAWLAKHLPSQEQAAVNKANDMLELIDQTINLVRQIATELRPGILDELGLTSAIEWQIQVFFDRHGIPCDYELDDIDHDLDDVCATTIFRVFQETLTNILRHADATHVIVKLINQEDSVLLYVEDDGKGTSLKNLDGNQSLGILGMQERVNSVGGIMKIKSEVGKGMVVEVNIPTK